MKILRYYLLLFLSVLLLSPQFSSAEERVYLDITSADVRKINFAVPWFIHRAGNFKTDEYAKELADTLAKALKFHGIIDIIPTKAYGGSQNANWKGLGADFAILGLHEINAADLKLELRLFDIANDKMILGKSYGGKLDQKEEMLFRFCDSVITELTGSSGLGSSRIAFISQDKNKEKEAYVTDILGRSIRQVTRHRNLVVSPRFVPGGSYFSYTSYHTGNQNLYITDLHQNKVTRVLSRRKGMNLAPGWSPDGQNMILTLSYEGNPDLYLLNKRGKILRQLTRNLGMNVSPTYSPDGEKIVFVSDRRGTPQLFLMELKTGNVQRLTYEGTENAEPSWHPTEDIIVYSSLRSGVYQICTLKLGNRRESLQLTEDLSHHESPAWSPDGNQIIFSKQAGRKNKIYAIMKNGTFQRQLFSFPGSQTSPRWSQEY